MRTNQELFETVARHLLTQRRKAKDPNTHVCMYRIDGLKCAVGCLIPEEKYKPYFEGHSLVSYDQSVGLSVWNTKGARMLWELAEAADIAEEQIPLALALQRIHDNDLVAEWFDLLKELALFFGLDTDFLSNGPSEVNEGPGLHSLKEFHDV